MPTAHVFGNGAALPPPAPIGCATFSRAERHANMEPSRWRLKVSPTRERGGCPPPRLQLTESRRMAAGRIRGRFAYPPRPFTLWVAPLRAFFLCHAMGGFDFHEFPIVVRTSTLHSRKEIIGSRVFFPPHGTEFSLTHPPHAATIPRNQSRRDSQVA